MANNDIKALNTAFNIIADYVGDIAKHFNFKVDSDRVKLDFGSDVFLASVTLDCEILAVRNYSSSDFDSFCNQKKFVGTILFNSDRTVTFILSSKENGKPISDPTFDSLD
jgi:hypothetical protein